MKIIFDDTELTPLIQRIVAETVATLVKLGVSNEERLAYSESEAAALIGVRRHVLRDCRLRGEISAHRCGKRVLYERSELVRFVSGRG